MRSNIEWHAKVIPDVRPSRLPAARRPVTVRPPAAVICSSNESRHLPPNSGLSAVLNLLHTGSTRLKFRLIFGHFTAERRQS